MYTKKKELTCKDAEKLVMPYVENTLEIGELEQFMEHVESCENCREELSIQFLVNTGLKSLEAGNNFDLNYELIASLEASRKRVQKKRLWQTIFRGAVIISLISAVVMVLLWLYLWV